MEKPEKGNLALPASGLLLLTFTVGGLLWFDVPLKSRRPPQPSPFVQQTFENETVRARLWQDPFGPVYADRDAATQPLSPHAVQTIADRVAQRARPLSDQGNQADNQSGKSNVLLMAALVPGSSYSEDAEIRRRTRHALISALAAKGYVASSGERIGYLETRWHVTGQIPQTAAGETQQSTTAGAREVSVRIPFEWFERDLLKPANQRASTEWVLVTWLNEEAFQDHTMLKLNELFSDLLEKTIQRPNGQTDATSISAGLKRVPLRLIGPTSSSTLLALMDPADRERMRFPSQSHPDSLVQVPAPMPGTVERTEPDKEKEADDNQDENKKPESKKQRAPAWYVLENLKIYSNRATAPQALLVRQRNMAVPSSNLADKERLSGQTISSLMREDYAVDFVSTVVRDDESAIALVDELQRRGVDLTSNRHHVALIGEWDTFFGRGLPFAVEAAIQYRSGAESTGWNMAGTMQLMLDGHIGTPPRVHRFSYMRGLDGSTSQSEARSGPRQESSDESSGKPWEVDVSQWERPIGPSGLDYMRRVAEKLSQLDRKLIQKGERLKAIGVVGSDVYDKLLVLQALRARFPNVIFFTTDLDARLLHPSQYPWCRNLVVASSYGLELTSMLQQQIPPFRDSYQTSTFFAGLLALGNDEALKTLKTGPKDGGNPDQLWEATTTNQPLIPQPFLKPRLYEVARSGAYDITPDSYESPLHPQPFNGRPSARSFARSLLLLLIVGLLFLPLNRNFRRFCIDRRFIDPADREALNYFTIFTLLSIAVFAGLIYLDGHNGEGEPFEMFQGISIWPTEMCRMLMVFSSWVLFVLAIISIKVSNQKLENDDMLLPDDDRGEEPVFHERWSQIRERGLRLWLRLSKSYRTGLFLRPVQRCIVEWRLFWRARMQISINSWFQQHRMQRRPIGHEAFDIGPLWNRYRELGQIGNRLWRFMPLVFLYMAYGWCLTLLLGEVPVPYRGTIAGATDSVLYYLSTLALVALTFFVVDATRLCERFIRIVTYRSTRWPATPFITMIANDRGVAPEEMSDYITVQVIARRTEAVGKLIIYPFLILFIALFAGNSYFDNWRWPLQSILFFGLILVYAMICAIVLRNAAEGARSKALGRMRQKMLKAYGSAAKDKGARVAQMEVMIDEIQALRRGAFVPWSKHPIVRAVLIPFGGVGTVALLEVLSTMSR